MTIERDLSAHALAIMETSHGGGEATALTCTEGER